MKLRISVFLMCMAMVLLFFSCGLTNRLLPNEDDLVKVFDENKEDILLVVSFLDNSEYANIYISGDDVLRDEFSMLADMKEIVVSNNNICAAMYVLLGNNLFESISMRGNTIAFLFSHKTDGTSCGLAYSRDGNIPANI